MLRDVLLLQKREIEQRLAERYVPRDFRAGKAVGDLIQVVIGPRRAGKSFFAMHLIQGLGPFGYVNFDDERIGDLGDYDALLVALDSVYGRPRHLLLDEIQNLPRWELFVNRLQRQGYRLVVTGGNAHLLSSELATHLTGRHLQIVMLPFSYREYLRTLERPPTEPERAEGLRRYAETGGFPEPLLRGIEHREYLTTLLRAVLYKDVVVRHRVRSPQTIEDLSRCALSAVAQEYSSRRLAEVSRLGSVHTVDKYLGYLEEAFLVFSLRRFSFKVREQVKANRKLYCVDNGLVTAGGFRFSHGVGRLFENLVAIALHKRELEGELEVFFWKAADGAEVDFVLKRGLKVVQLVQVCADAEAPATRDREVRGLLKASRDLGCKDLVVLTASKAREERARWFGMEGRVRYVPLWEWLGGQGE